MKNANSSNSNAYATIDKSGKLYLPKNVRNKMNLQPGEDLYITVNPDSSITVKKAGRYCPSCGRLYDPTERNYYICQNCREILNSNLT